MKRLLLCLFCLCAFHLAVSAHVLDQYLQVAQIALARDGVRVELRLIPGVEVAQRVLALMDADSNRQISATEEQAYAQRVGQDIALSINGVNTPLTLTETQFPTPQEMRAGTGMIRLTLTATTTLRQADNQQIYFRNNHRPELGVYLVNALVPTTQEIKISGQVRDALQREMRLHFRVASTGWSSQRSWTGVLMFCLCLALLLPQLKHLRQVLHHNTEKKMHTKKTVV